MREMTGQNFYPLNYARKKIATDEYDFVTAFHWLSLNFDQKFTIVNLLNLLFIGRERMCYFLSKITEFL